LREFGVPEGQKASCYEGAFLFLGKAACMKSVRFGWLSYLKYLLARMKAQGITSNILNKI
jgi:hypothetical protein